MEPPAKTTAKDFFINLGAIIALGVVVFNLVGLLFTVINWAYPQISGGYYGSSSISFPVASLIIFFPVYVFLMWLLEKDYRVQPEKRNMGVRKWLTFITLFISGFALAGDLVTVLYYFLDGRELTAGFILKVLAVLLISLMIFFYYILDAMGKLNATWRKVWAGAALVVILGSIIWGFSVLGSPRTQQLLKYDDQKLSDLQNLNSQIESYYATKGTLPKSIEELEKMNYYVSKLNPQTKKPYEYERKSDTIYNLCAEFNKPSEENIGKTYYGPVSWTHPAGRYCFERTINPNLYSKPIPLR